MTDSMLSGVRIIELGHVLAGPFTTSLCADFGAEVIKVEDPGNGDMMRELGPVKDGTKLWWKVTGRNKKCVTLNLKDPRGVALCKQLIAQADAVVENFRPGTLEKWDLSYETMKARNPGLVLLRISGFGQTGPYSERAGYDRIALAFGGLMGITGYADRPPVRIGTSIADYQSAILGAFAMMMAIYHRDLHGGEGQSIDLAMYESIIRFTEVLVPAYDRLGTVRERRGNKHFAAAPGEHFRTSDGRYLILTVSADAGFRRLAEAMGRDDWLADPRLASHEKRWEHVDELNAALAAWIESLPVDELCARLDEAKLAYSFIFSIEDIMNDPHYKARGTIASVTDPKIGPVRMAGVVPRFSGTPEKPIESAPDLGQHNQEIYGGMLGLSAQRIAELTDAGVL